MYYPLLRARQFELIAIRELAQEGNLSHTSPILEPVKDSFNNFKLAFDILQRSKTPVFLILNPMVGAVSGDTNIVANFLRDYNDSYTYIKPAFYFRNNTEFISGLIEEYGFTNCLIICSGSTNPEDVNFQNLIEREEVTDVVIDDASSNRALTRYLRRLDKSLVRLDDLFEKEARNSNFLEFGERKFSEEHLYFEDEGFSGIADYTTLPSEFVDGGSAPRAVVIHLTYIKDNNQIWIRHFTSTSNDSIANVQGKFGEAAEKAVTFCRGKNLTNSAIEELERFYDEAHYPGLGTVKKISIKNHISIVNQYMQTL